MSQIATLDRIIADHHLLKHPFYQAWTAGTLSREVLQRYASQYYAQVKSFPRFISRTHTHCDVIEVRKILLENLVDEEIHGTDHPELWMQFAEGLGATRDTVINDLPNTETQDLVDRFYALADRDWRDGLCALYAYESQVPAVSASKIEGLMKFYGVQDERTLEFFTAHQAYDVLHASQVAGLIEKYANPKQAEQAVTEAAQALWGFLDGMCREAGISCHS